MEDDRSYSDPETAPEETEVHDTTTHDLEVLEGDEVALDATGGGGEAPADEVSPEVAASDDLAEAVEAAEPETVAPDEPVIADEPEPDVVIAAEPEPEEPEVAEEVADEPEPDVVVAAEPEPDEPEPEIEIAVAVDTDGEGPAVVAYEDDEEEEEDERFLPGDWYVVHTYAGYENKVRANLGSRIQSMNMEDKIFDVVIPTEEVMEIKSGRKQVVQKKVFPGYILVRMMLDDDSWYVVRNTPGVTGFVGAGAKPTPLSVGEVGKILSQKPVDRKPKVEFEEGEVVQVIAGPFANMSGPVDEINAEQQTVKVLVNIFGRETPVTLAFDQVAKL